MGPRDTRRSSAPPSRASSVCSTSSQQSAVRIRMSNMERGGSTWGRERQMIKDKYKPLIRECKKELQEVEATKCRAIVEIKLEGSSKDDPEELSKRAEQLQSLIEKHTMEMDEENAALSKRVEEEAEHLVALRSSPRRQSLPSSRRSSVASISGVRRNTLPPGTDVEGELLDTLHLSPTSLTLSQSVDSSVCGTPVSCGSDTASPWSPLTEDEEDEMQESDKQSEAAERRAKMNELREQEQKIEERKRVVRNIEKSLDLRLAEIEKKEMFVQHNEKYSTELRGKAEELKAREYKLQLNEKAEGTLATRRANLSKRIEGKEIARTLLDSKKNELQQEGESLKKLQAEFEGQMKDREATLVKEELHLKEEKARIEAEMKELHRHEEEALAEQAKTKEDKARLIHSVTDMIMKLNEETQVVEAEETAVSRREGELVTLLDVQHLQEERITRMVSTLSETHQLYTRQESTVLEKKTDAEVELQVIKERKGKALDTAQKLQLQQSIAEQDEEVVASQQLFLQQKSQIKHFLSHKAHRLLEETTEAADTIRKKISDINNETQGLHDRATRLQGRKLMLEKCTTKLLVDDKEVFVKLRKLRALYSVNKNWLEVLRCREAELEELEHLNTYQDLPGACYQTLPTTLKRLKESFLMMLKARSVEAARKDRGKEVEALRLSDNERLKGPSLVPSPLMSTLKEASMEGPIRGLPEHRALHDHVKAVEPNALRIEAIRFEERDVKALEDKVQSMNAFMSLEVETLLQRDAELRQESDLLGCLMQFPIKGTLGQVKRWWVNVHLKAADLTASTTQKRCAHLSESVRVIADSVPAALEPPPLGDSLKCSHSEEAYNMLVSPNAANAAEVVL